MEKRYNKKNLILQALLIFILALLPRLLLLYFTSLAHQGNLSVLVNIDEARYIQEAGEVLNASKLLWDVPLYPIFLAAFFKMFGASYLLASILNIFLFSLAVVIFYLTIVRFFNRLEALITAAIMILFPTLLIDILYPAAEALYLLLLSLAFYTFLSYLKYEKLVYIALTALILSLLTLTKETFFFFPLIIAAMIFIKNFPGFRRAFKAALFLIAVYILILSPLLIYNYHAYGKIGLSQKMVGVIKTLPENLDAIKRKKITATPNYNPVITVKNFLWERKRFFLGTGTFGLMRAIGYNTTKLETVADSPQEYLKTLKEYGPGWVIFQYLALFFTAFVLLSSFLAMLLFLIKRNWKELSYFMLVIFYFITAYSYRYNSRYSIVLVPFLSLLSAYLYSRIYLKFKARLSLKR
jgi:4-amino-4-deoxy-L-arabinose transferase-like glycosyltransferase